MARWNEALHPRDRRGRFTTVAGGAVRGAVRGALGGAALGAAGGTGLGALSFGGAAAKKSAVRGGRAYARAKEASKRSGQPLKWDHKKARGKLAADTFGGALAGALIGPGIGAAVGAGSGAIGGGIRGGYDANKRYSRTRKVPASRSARRSYG